MMADQNPEIVSLIRKRGSLKSRLTKLENVLNQFESDPNADFETLDLEGRLARHRPLLDESEQICTEIESLTDDETVVKSFDDEHTLIEDRYFAINGRIKKFIRQHSSPSVPSRLNQTTYESIIDESEQPRNLQPSGVSESLDSVPGTSNSQPLVSPLALVSQAVPANQNAANQNASHIFLDPNLPKLSLPTFSGSFDTWLSFRDTFNSMVHNNTQVPDIFKFHYLKSCVKDEAAEVIASLETSNDNYVVAWKLLTDRYDNRKFIVENHVKALFNLPSISRDFSIRSLLDSVQKHIRALRALEQPVDQWDLVIIHLIKEKLNNYNREKWEEFTGNSTVPTFKCMVSFLERRAQIEVTRPAHNSSNSSRNSHKNNSASGQGSNPPRTFMASFPNSQASSQSHNESKYSKIHRSCPICKGDHAIFTCSKFLKLSPQDRLAEARNASLCVNCLRASHRSSDCRLSTCRKCNKRHNTLLHFEQKSEQANQSDSIENQASTSSTSNYHIRVPSQVYLATAIVDIIDNQGNYQPCRVMLDGGAQSCTITDSCATRLGLLKKPFEIPMLAIDNLKTNIKFRTFATIKSRFNDQKSNLEFLVVHTISNAMPSFPLDRNAFKIPENVFLADPHFHEPAPVEIIIGAEYVYEFLLAGKMNIPGHSAVLQKTTLGWIVAGRVYDPLCKRNITQKLSVCNVIQHTSFPLLWELEQVQPSSKRSKEEQACETHFTEHVQRDDSGRYTVKLPFNEKINQIGESKNIAFQRFYSIEKKFEKDPSLKEHYSACVNNYLDEGHMSEVTDKKALDQGYYLPHHAVVREDSLTTKTRVVFDASMKSSTGISLNDCLMVGPTVQDDLVSIFMRFRSFQFALTADIQQMYRQIKVYPTDSDYQKILWRNNPNEPIKIYSLNRVTFGTASAPFLATRTLQQLADDEQKSLPIAARILRRDFYVDDLLTGAQTFEEALSLRNELIELLHKGGFSLRKWGSNDKGLISDFPGNSTHTHMSLDPTETIKTLGLHWDSQTDSIVYTVNISDDNEKITKRSILSQTAKLFDPLGLLGPVIVSAKIIIQLLWKAKIEWDDPIPYKLQTSWIEFKNQLTLVNNLRYKRCIVIPNTVETQIHGFCDASTKAYGACIYLRSMNNQGEHYCSLICSKSRVAPLKVISLPKLELCAALLLTKLYQATIQSLKLPINKTFFWSDSTIALSWIATEPYTLPTFEANRVAEIQKVTPDQWFHVPTAHNPADLISRGQNPKDFLQATIWQSGPVWLSQDESHWPETRIISSINSQKTIQPSCSFTLTNSSEEKEWKIHFKVLLEKYSHTKKLKTVLAYSLRFIHNMRERDLSKKIQGPLSFKELDFAMLTMVKLVQKEEFQKEIDSLSCGKDLDKKSSLLSLNPFLDQGIIRVGGRLERANIPYAKKHPIVLPRSHYVTKLIIREEHIAKKHAGTQATLYGVRELFWPIDGRNVTRHVIHKCVRCFRAKPRGISHIMGNLPEKRLSYSRPFLNVGVDYCGPFFVKQRRHRNRGKDKVHIATFICFATKAVHLEVVSDESTEAFLGCLKRFFSRRGKSVTIHSDNGRNFVGANNELKRLYEFINLQLENNAVKQFLLENKVTWHFNPPSSPHFGGLWEASVKSFKHHLTRTIEGKLLTYEQLETCTIEIEAILNSRPLTPMSSDPNDLLPLTPGHFLIGESLTSFPQMDYRDVPVNRLSCWQEVEQIRQHFWARWYKEYLNELQSRNKWKTSANSTNIKVGTLVILAEDNVPPMCWKVGRTTEVFPGKDGIIRVASVRTRTGEYKRCVKKLYPLPIYDVS